jgi:hypothetical protein
MIGGMGRVSLRSKMLDEHNRSVLGATGPLPRCCICGLYMFRHRLHVRKAMCAKALTLKALQPAWQHAAYVVRLITQ